MIRPSEITNAGMILFQVAFLVTIKTVLKLPFWLEFVFTAALLLSIIGTVIHSLDLPARLAARQKKGRSLQEACQAHHVSYFRSPESIGEKWSEVFSTVMISQPKFYAHMHRRV